MIVFEKVRYKNFLSTGNTFIEIPLNLHKTTLMVGKNGSGKSTILDAICFSLFGKPFRDINKPQLLNSINGKDCVVEIEFSIGTNKYLIRRGIKPNIFDIIMNGNKLNKNADAMDYQKYLENTILKLNYKSFTQIVILGSSSFVPFMQLSAADRRVVVEDILDITIFSSINNVLKERVSALKDEIKQCDTQIEIAKGKLELQNEHIERIEKQLETSKTDKEQEIESKRKEIQARNDEVKKLQEEIAALSDSILDKDSVSAQIKKVERIKIQGAEKKKAITKSLKFYQEHDDCPECKQPIESGFREKMVAKRTEALSTIDETIVNFDTELKTLQARTKEIASVGQNISALSKKIQEHSTEIVALNRFIDSLQMTFGGEIDVAAEKEKLSQIQEELDGHLEEKRKLLHKQKLQDVAQTLLKDSGIKTKIIRQYLPAINTLINKYLTDLNFYASFYLDENFKEEIKSRNRDNFSYGSFSEGQKMRIDLALLFTWREIAKMKNSVNTNLLFLDEIFDGSLDVEGIDEFMKLLKASEGSHNTFLISHKTDQLLDKFNSVIHFELKSNFTVMKVA